MKKVLQITSSLARNGTETFIMNVYRHIDRTRVQFDFLIFTEDAGGFCAEALSLGATIYRLPTRRSGVVRYYRALRDFFCQNAHEYVAIHYSGCSLTSVLPLYMARKYGVPVRVVHSHNSRTEGIHNVMLHKLNKHLASHWGTVFLACSDKAAAWFYKNTRAEKMCAVVKNGISISDFEYNPVVREKYRKQMGLENCFVVGHVGRYTEVKNHTFLLKVFKELLPVVPEARLLLIGSGELKQQIVEEVFADENMMGKVILLEDRTDVNHLMQVMDCFVMPSLFEGLPFVLVEAQCAGLKVLCSDTVSREVKLTGNIAFMSLDEPAEKWAESVRDYCGYHRESVSKEIADKGFSIGGVASELVELYLK